MISDILPGQTINDHFVVRKITDRNQKNKGKPYLSFELGDSTGRIFGTLWEKIAETRETIKEGKIVYIRGKVIDWNGNAHICIDEINLPQSMDSLRIQDFIPAKQQNSNFLFTDFMAFANNMENPFLKNLLVSIFTDKNIQQQFLESPGGKLWHHCYKGGLLEHTLNVVKILDRTAGLFPYVNKDLLLAGGMLHDIGKIKEFKMDGFIDYSDQGRLLGHIAMGHHIAANFIAQIDGFPVELSNKLLHLILSHQGGPECGSPVVPMCREAILLNYADEMDAKMNAFARIYEKEKQKGQRWSNYIKLLDRFFYFGDQEKQVKEYPV